MNPERWQQIKTLFHSALEQEAERRSAFLDAACAGDERMRSEVESLVAAHQKDGDFFEIATARIGAGIIAHNQTELEVGRRIGSYSILGTLGEGGMGKVYLAHDVRLGRKVALKLLPASFTLELDRVQRFEQEARAASALNHPNILTIHEIGADDGISYIATEFVQGMTLRARLKQGRMKLDEVLEIAIQLAAALNAAHTAKIVHRDVKPENIMVRDDGYVKILDFGLAKPFAREAQAGREETDTDSLSGALVNTQPGVVMGTMAYMSPEQARGLLTDARTDIWSLGCVLYEMLAGRQPFTGQTNSDVMAAVLNREPPSLAQLMGEVSPELERIVLKVLTKDREERYQTVKDFLIDLRRLKQRMEFEAELGRTASAAEIRSDGAVAFAGHSSPARVAQAPSEQLKQVTVLFADFYGLTPRMESLDPEEASDIMRELWNRVDTAIMDFGGMVDRHMGNQVMALWGVKTTHEDDPEHAVSAALAVQREVSEFVCAKLADASDVDAARQPLMRFGINTGPVLLSTLGSRGEFTATGVAVNIAHRLEQSAPVGSILISHDTYHHVRGLFDVQELELPNVKGRDEPARTYVVRGAKARAFRLRTRGVEGVETRMVGRLAELTRLRDILQMVIEDGETQVVNIIGDAGLGKSRLLYEFSSEVELLPARLNILNGRARQWTRDIPFSLVRDVLSFRFGIQDSDSPVVARERLVRGILEIFGDNEEGLMRAHFIGHLLGLDFSGSPFLVGILNDAKQVRGRAFHYASEFFSMMAALSPTILYLEDLHWADDGSLDFIDHLSRKSGAIALLVLCFARPDLLERRPAWGEGLSTHTRMNLLPLTRRESRQLVEEILRHAQSIPQVLRELIVSAAEGNPFYVEELIKMLIDQKVILPAADQWRVDASRLVEVRVPPTLTGILQARLDGLSAVEKIVLQRASIIGREFWDGALEEFALAAFERGETGADETRPALESLRRKELIYRRETSAFMDTCEYVFKHALLRSVTYENVLKRDRRRLHKETAQWLIKQSGERVEEYVAVIAEHYELAREIALAAEWYGRAGGQARSSYAPEAAIRFYRKALDFMREALKADEQEGAALDLQSIRWYSGLGEVLTMQAHYDEAVEAYTQMRERAEEHGDLVAQARALNGLTAVREYQGDNRAALESAQLAERLALAAGETTPAKTELAVALNRQGLASHRLGDAAAVIALGQRILKLSAEMDDGAGHARANGLKLLGVAYEVSGSFVEAHQCFEQSLAMLRELGDRRNIGFMLNNLGVIAHLQGDYGSAVVRYEEALNIFREIGERTWELPTLGNLAGAQLGLEKYAEAGANLQQAVAMTGAAGHFALSMIYCYLAESYWGQGETALALETALTALALGQKAENQDYIGNAWRTLGLVAARLPAPVIVNGQPYTAADCFAESRRVYTEMGAEAERAYTLRAWARYERERGNDEVWEPLMEEAREIFARLKMTHELARMSAAF